MTRPPVKKMKMSDDSDVTAPLSLIPWVCEIFFVGNDYPKGREAAKTYAVELAKLCFSVEGIKFAAKNGLLWEKDLEFMHPIHRKIFLERTRQLS